MGWPVTQVIINCESREHQTVTNLRSYPFDFEKWREEFNYYSGHCLVGYNKGIIKYVQPKIIFLIRVSLTKKVFLNFDRSLSL